MKVDEGSTLLFRSISQWKVAFQILTFLCTSARLVLSFSGSALGMIWSVDYLLGCKRRASRASCYSCMQHMCLCAHKREIVFVCRCLSFLYTFISRRERRAVQPDFGMLLFCMTISHVVSLLSLFFSLHKVFASFILKSPGCSLSSWPCQLLVGDHIVLLCLHPALVWSSLLFHCHRHSCTTVIRD